MVFLQTLKDTNRLDEAEPLMRRALAIDEACYGQDHPRVAIDLNSLAELLQDTNRLDEAEPLMRRALAIDEAAYGQNHPRVAIDLNNLAQLLDATNQLSEAEPLMRRALDIDEASYGKDHPNVAIQLNNLAQLLKSTNRLSEAEPLMLRALAIDEAAYGQDHPRVAIDLNNLAALLEASNRLSEAEPLMLRALAIQQSQRVRKSINELDAPELEDRLRAIQVLAAIGVDTDATTRQAARQGVVPLVAVLLDRQRQLVERLEAVSALVVIGGGTQASEAVVRVFEDAGERVELRRAAAEALGRIDADREETQTHWRLLEASIRGEPLREETSTERITALLPLLQGASRGLQLLAARELPMWGEGAGRPVPMLTLTTCGGAVSTEVVEGEVWQLPLPGGIPLEMVMIPDGEFLMGSPSEEEGRDAYSHRPETTGVDVEAQRKVKVPGFAMARYPITQAQWRAVADLEPVESDLNPNPAEAKGTELPAQFVCWHDAMEWCSRLNRHLSSAHGETALLMALPSEAQWEFACRAGRSTPFHFGDTLDPTWANYHGDNTYGPGEKGPFLNHTTPVGAYGLVNSWGLADMHGNVWEWCQDLWHPSLLEGPIDGSAFLDPAWDLTEAIAQQRLLRGGSWYYGPRICRSAFRDACHPKGRGRTVGFRVCAVPKRSGS